MTQVIQEGLAITPMEFAFLVWGPPQLREWAWVPQDGVGLSSFRGDYDFECERDGVQMTFRLIDDLYYRVDQ